MATLDKQDTGQRQTRHRTKTNKAQHNTENEKDEQHGHHEKARGEV